MKTLRVVNNYLASATLTLAMLIIFIMVTALFLSAATRFITGTGFAWFIELPPVLVSWFVFPLLGPLLKKWQQIKVDFLCRDSILAAPIVLDLVLFLDLAKRSDMSGIQEWLSFYFKSPMCSPDLEPEHDLFVQLAKLKNTLRHIMGEDLITHLGLDYYKS